MADPLREEAVALRDGRRLSIRPVRAGDEEALLENVNLVAAEHAYLLMDRVPVDLDAERAWIASFDGERSALFLAVDGDAIVGQADCRGGEFPKIAHSGVIGIAVRDGWREAGLGRILMERVLEWMRSRGFLTARLSVFASNVRARRLYESLGFEVEGTRRKHVRIHGELVDEVLMALWLREPDG
ncbi:MAG TPA: GNAT family N-acetyltransferase [Thermoplasmata archaeon]|jgi:RimJ/RimL family protein N-acetyltransferase|nr:GNAT family N-acetyltransferase [Thermoplasmata archaeon]